MGCRDALRIDKRGVECPGTGGLEVAETDTRIRQPVVEHWREDPVQVLCLRNVSNLSYPVGDPKLTVMGVVVAPP